MIINCENNLKIIYGLTCLVISEICVQLDSELKNYLEEKGHMVVTPTCIYDNNVAA